MRRWHWLATAAPLVWLGAADAATINLDGDLGCDTLQLQRERIDAIKVSITATQLIARGAATPDVMHRREAAIARAAAISRGNCRRLAGPFTVMAREPVDGGSIVRVGFGTGSLWVLVPGAR
jgi:hypothetical protein